VELTRDQFVLVPASDGLLGLERQPAQHTPFARNLRDFLKAVDEQFDVCVIDTQPNPDIRLIAAMATGDFVICPIQLNQEAIDGVRALFKSGWGLVRASNTQPAITLRFEAYTAPELVEYIEIFKSLLDRHPEIGFPDTPPPLTTAL